MPFEAGALSEICYVTADVDAAVDRWVRTTGAGPFFEFPCPTSGIWVRGQIIEENFRAAIGFVGMTVIELLEPRAAAPSIFTEVLREKGEGAVHHIYPKMRRLDAADYDRVCAGYEAMGMAKAMDFTVPGIGRNCFYDGREQVGSYIEVLEINALVEQFNDHMHAAHVKGVEGRPLRHFQEIFDAIGGAGAMATN